MGHLGSILLIVLFTLGVWSLVRHIHATGRALLTTRTLWWVLIGGYGLTGARFVHTMEAATWADGLVGFGALCGALVVSHLIRRVCPSCHRRLSLEEHVLRPPTRDCPGVGTVVWCCTHCGHHAVRSHTIPRLAETSAEVGPWVPPTEEESLIASFGGRYSAGISGSLSWRTPEVDDAATE